MIQSQIKTQIIEAMKARDAIRMETLRGLSAQFTNELVNLKRKPDAELSDEEANKKGLELLEFIKLIYKPIPVSAEIQK